MFLSITELLQNFKMMAFNYKEIIADPEKNLGRFTKEDKVHGNRFCDEKLEWIEVNRDMASHQSIQDKKTELEQQMKNTMSKLCLLYTSPSPRDATLSRMPSSA